MWEWETLKRFIHGMKKWEGSGAGIYLDMVLGEMERLEKKPGNPEFSLPSEGFYTNNMAVSKSTMFKDFNNNHCEETDNHYKIQESKQEGHKTTQSDINAP